MEQLADLYSPHLMWHLSHNPIIRKQMQHAIMSPYTASEYKVVQLNDALLTDTGLLCNIHGLHLCLRQFSLAKLPHNLIHYSCK